MGWASVTAGAGARRYFLHHITITITAPRALDPDTAAAGADTVQFSRAEPRQSSSSCATLVW